MSLKSCLCLCSVALLLSPTAEARIWRVNNNPGIDADYAAAQAAHDAATTQDGDTLHLEASQTSYGDLSLTKALVLIGPGYFLNQNTGLQANPTSATLGTITFEAGSSGGVVMGVTANIVRLKASNVGVQRCFLQQVDIEPVAGPIGNLLIVQNYIDLRIGGSGSGTTNPVSGVLIANNYVRVVVLPVFYSGLMTNNVIGNYQGGFSIHNFTLRNNILVTGSFQPNNNQYDHNMGAGFGTANGNVAPPANWNLVFAGATGNSTDGQWQLVAGAGNPARGSGAGGVDMGIFGGPSPYRLSGIPAIPSISDLNVPPTGGSGSPLNVTISVQSNN